MVTCPLLVICMGITPTRKCNDKGKVRASHESPNPDLRFCHWQCHIQYNRTASSLSVIKTSCGRGRALSPVCPPFRCSNILRQRANPAGSGLCRETAGRGTVQVPRQKVCGETSLSTLRRCNDDAGLQFEEPIESCFPRAKSERWGALVARPWRVLGGSGPHRSSAGNHS